MFQSNYRCLLSINLKLIQWWRILLLLNRFNKEILSNNRENITPTLKWLLKKENWNEVGATAIYVKIIGAVEMEEDRRVRRAPRRMWCGGWDLRHPSVCQENGSEHVLSCGPHRKEKGWLYVVLGWRVPSTTTWGLRLRSQLTVTLLKLFYQYIFLKK